MARLRITVRVRPGSSVARVGGSYGPDGDLVVAVHAQPVAGAANEAVVKALAAALGIHRRDVTVVSGLTARTKVVDLTVPDGELEALRSRVTALRGAEETESTEGPARST